VHVGEVECLGEQRVEVSHRVDRRPCDGGLDALVDVVGVAIELGEVPGDPLRFVGGDEASIDSAEQRNDVEEDL
jgi:hypothetical protein